MSEFHNHFRRVFGSLNAMEDGSVYADGWPDPVEYDEAIALDVLLDWPDGWGRTAERDADICRALEKAGAVIGGES